VKNVTCLIGTALLVALSASVRAQAVPADLANAKSLYASAAYEEALAELAKIDAANWDEHVDEYRALCLVALGRTSEAEQTLEHLVRLKPFHSMAPNQMSPRVVSLFKAVRRETLPSVARDMYKEAKTLYDAGRLDEALVQFRQLGTLLSEDDLVAHTPNLADVKQLADGFLKLAEARVAAAPKPSPPVPPKPAVVATPRTFTEDDHDVTPPVAIDRRLPEWKPLSATRVPGTVRGLLEIVTGTGGGVESAKLVKSVSPAYDRTLLEAAKTWKFQPAKKDGQPVRYRWLMEIVLERR
jgi:TonB family protein